MQYYLWKIILYSDYLGISNLKDVSAVVWEARSKWYNIGVNLSISPDTLDTIQSDNHHVSENCFMAVLKVWLRRVQPRPTWDELAEALRSPTVGYGHLADEMPLHNDH